MKKPVILLAVATAGLFAAAPVTASGPQERMLSAVVGQGSGMAEVRFSSADVGLSAEITVNVHGTAPNTVFYLQRAPEIGRPLGSDGICQRALGLWPWEQPNSAGPLPCGWRCRGRCPAISRPSRPTPTDRAAPTFP
jgi:hypothetical protein